MGGSGRFSRVGLDSGRTLGDIGDAADIDRRSQAADSKASGTSDPEEGHRVGGGGRRGVESEL